MSDLNSLKQSLDQFHVVLPAICLNCSHNSRIRIDKSCIDKSYFAFCSLMQLIPSKYKTFCRCYSPLDTQLEFNFD